MPLIIDLQWRQTDQISFDSLQCYIEKHSQKFYRKVSVNQIGIGSLDSVSEVPGVYCVEVMMDPGSFK